MAKSLEEILGWLELTGTIKTTTTGIPNPFPKEFFTTTKPTDGNKGRYTRVNGQRKVARSIRYGAKPPLRELLNVGEVDVKLIHNKEEQELDPNIFKHLRSYDSWNRDLGVSEVKRQVSEFKQLFENLRIAAVAQMLSLKTSNKIYFDGDGYLLPTSSGAVETVDYQVAATHQNQLNSIISASWATTSTDIPLQLRNLRKQALRDTGYELKYAFYGENIPSYLDANTKVQAYLARNPTWSDQWLNKGEIPDGLFGFTWVPVYGAFFEDASGTNQDLWSADHVTFTPAVSGKTDPKDNNGAMSSWYEMMEGTFEVPRRIAISSDAASAINDFETVVGMFCYGSIDYKYGSIATIAGQTFLPVLKNPDAIYAADVTP